MKILCSISGIEFACDYFPGTFHSRETFHPVFNLPQKKLLSYTGKWAAGELTPTDAYLLFLSILRSSDLVEFRVPVFRNEHTAAIIAQNMEFLVRTIIKLNTVSTPSVVFPRYVITPETRFLANVHHWIQNWQDSYQDFLDGYKSAHDSAKLITRENALQRMIKNPHKHIREYAAQIADWAAVAGEFPIFLTPSPLNSGLQIPVAEYWKQLIIRACKEEYLFTIPRSDLEELLEHCEDKIPVGSIYSNALFKLLRGALEKQRNFLGLGDFDVRTSFQILTQDDTVETANLKAMVDSAPLEVPAPEQYPNKLQYLRAKMRFEMAQKIEKERNEAGERRAGE